MTEFCDTVALCRSFQVALIATIIEVAVEVDVQVESAKANTIKPGPGRPLYAVLEQRRLAAVAVETKSIRKTRKEKN